MFEITTVPTRARGTDLVRLRPASASVRFLEIFPVRRPNSSLRRTIGLRPPSASVRFQNFFSVRRPNPSLRRTKRICPPSVTVRFEIFLTVLRPNPSFRRTEGICPASASVRFEKNFDPPLSGVFWDHFEKWLIIEKWLQDDLRLTGSNQLIIT